MSLGFRIQKGTVTHQNYLAFKQTSHWNFEDLNVHASHHPNPAVEAVKRKDLLLLKLLYIDGAKLRNIQGSYITDKGGDYIIDIARRLNQNIYKFIKQKQSRKETKAELLKSHPHLLKPQRSFITLKKAARLVALAKPKRNKHKRHASQPVTTHLPTLPPSSSCNEARKIRKIKPRGKFTKTNSFFVSRKRKPRLSNGDKGALLFRNYPNHNQSKKSHQRSHSTTLAI